MVKFCLCYDQWEGQGRWESELYYRPVLASETIHPVLCERLNAVFLSSIRSQLHFLSHAMSSQRWANLSRLNRLLPPANPVQWPASRLKRCSLVSVVWSLTPAAPVKPFLSPSGWGWASGPLVSEQEGYRDVEKHLSLHRSPPKTQPQMRITTWLCAPNKDQEVSVCLGHMVMRH